MKDHARGLLLTRPLDQSFHFLANCEALLGRRIEAVISPVIDIVATDSQPDLDAARTIVVTSGNAVRMLGAALSGRDVATVGAATADLARSFGARARAVGETAEEVIKNARDLEAPVLVCRGVHARMDMAEALNGLGIAASSATIYDQVERPLSPEAKALLAEDRDLVAPVFSPRSAALLSCLPRQARMIVPAISRAAADAWSGPADIRVANSPNAAAMAALVTEAL